MPTGTYNKFHCFVLDIGSAKHDFTTHALKVYLSAVDPTTGATWTRYGALGATTPLLAEFAGTGNGYTAGGAAVPSVTYTQTTGTAKLSTGGTDPTPWTASANWTNAFRYVPLYNDGSATDPLIAWWDYGSNLNLNSGETFTVDLGTDIFSLA